jgi:hypothetical protein
MNIPATVLQDIRTFCKRTCRFSQPHCAACSLRGYMTMPQLTLFGPEYRDAWFNKARSCAETMPPEFYPSDLRRVCPPASHPNHWGRLVETLLSDGYEYTGNKRRSTLRQCKGRVELQLRRTRERKAEAA